MGGIIWSEKALRDWWLKLLFLLMVYVFYFGRVNTTEVIAMCTG
jgi:hypothetical protein